jgi:CHAT domain-containing protein
VSIRAARTLVTLCAFGGMAINGFATPARTAVPTPPTASAASTARASNLPDPGTAIARPLGAGETHEYRTELRRGDYLAIDVEERGIDVQVRLLDPAGTILVDQRTPASRYDPDHLRVIATADGDYRVVLAANSPKPGRYDMRVRDRRVATARDRLEVVANEAYQGAFAIAPDGDGASQHDAIGRLDRAIEGARAAHSPQLEAEALLQRGRRHFILDERTAAIVDTEAALVIFQRLDTPHQEGVALNNVGAIYQEMAEPSRAIRYFERALPRLHAAEDTYGEAAVLHNLAWYYQQLGEYAAASRYYRRALPLWAKSGQLSGEAKSLDNLGRLNENLGDLVRAHSYFNDTLELCTRLGEMRCEIETRANLGALEQRSGDIAGSRAQFTRVLELVARAPDSVYEATADLGLAETDADRSADGAGRRMQEALRLARQVKDRRIEADALQQLGAWYRSRQDPVNAAASYSAALDLRRAVADARGEAETLLAIAELANEGGDLEGARNRAAEAIQVIETTRQRVAQPDLRSSYLADTQPYYDFYIDVLMRLHAARPSEGFDRRALQASELARARGLLDALAERRNAVLRKVDPRLLAREQELHRRVNAKDRRWREELASNESEGSVAEARRELEEALESLKELEGEMREHSAGYAQLSDPPTLEVAEFQRALDERTVVIEYWLGAQRSYAWGITSDSVVSATLPPGARIESAARDYIQSVVTRGTTTPISRDLGAALTHDLLTPFRELLLQRDRLVVVRYGTLEYLPFAALPSPTGRDGKEQSLAGTHEIANLPAATALAALRVPRASAPKTIAVFADPVFSREDPRVTSKPQGTDPVKGTAADEKILRQATEESGLVDLRRLRFSRAEAQAIDALVPQTQRLDALDFAANRAAVLGPAIRQYRIVHFATHGLMNGVHPELSGLALSAVNERGEAQDALLQVHDILGLPLKANLVVLSACETALGREIRGEGIIGLTRAFMYAGVPRVVSTLWSVDDRATAELMQQFYAGVLREGLTPAAALRAAQLRLAANPRWSAPYYWAGFILQGDWN